VSKTNGESNQSKLEHGSSDVIGESSVDRPSALHSSLADQSDSADESAEEMSVHIPPMEYMLGIGDLTGELMRVAINSIGIGDIEKPFELCSFLRGIHDGFLLFGNINRYLSRKMYTLKQSLQKVENGCYTLQVRGSEIPKHMLADVLNSSESDRVLYHDVDGTSDAF